MKILYGTTNKAKLEGMKEFLCDMGIEIIGLKDMGNGIPQVDESGNTPLENAKIKAKAYYEMFEIPVFACDTGLYFEEVEESEQPGVFVRRVKGKELSDDEMIEYYSDLAKKYGGELTARYKNAISFVLDENTGFHMDGESISTEKFIISSKISKYRQEGFPLDSLSVEPVSGVHYCELESYNADESIMKDGFRKFFTDCIFKVKGVKG